MDLKDLVGPHILTGVDTGILKGTYEDADTLLFCLDGVVYKATEDPDDGYRSYLRDLEVVDNTNLANTFEGVAVIGRYDGEDSHSDNDTLELVDAVNGNVILRVGTDNTDDYYPYCIMEFSPELMHVNQ